MLQTHFKLARPKKKNSKKIQKKKTSRTDLIESCDFIWLLGEGGEEGDLKQFHDTLNNGAIITS